MPWWVASLLSNVCIIWVEYVNRHAAGGWREALPSTVLPIVLAQYCLFVNFNSAPHWMLAWAVFALGSSTMRLVAVGFTPNAHIGSWLWVIGGVSVMMLGSFAMKQGLR